MARKLYPQEYLYPLLEKQSLEVQLIIRGKKHEHEIPDPSVYKTRAGYEQALRGVLNLKKGEFTHCPGMNAFVDILWAQGVYTKHCAEILRAERHAKRVAEKWKEEMRYRTAVD
jgi:hypothetical protein